MIYDIIRLKGWPLITLNISSRLYINMENDHCLSHELGRTWTGRPNTDEELEREREIMSCVHNNSSSSPLMLQLPDLVLFLE